MPHALRHGGISPWLAPLGFALWLFAAATPAAGADAWGEAQLLSDAADGRLDRFSLLEAAVIAGGVSDEAELFSARKKLQSLWLEVGAPLLEKLPAADRPRAIFSALHRLVLTGQYQAECTEVQRTLHGGDYNCVTATVLYLELCRRHGLNGSAVAIPAHVYCRLHGKQGLEVQTTCKDWFEVREGRATDSAAAGLAQQIAPEGVQPRELTDVQLIGKVYYNRGVSQLEAQNYPAAIALLKTSLTLDPQDKPASNNLLAAHNNWALALCDAGQFAAAAEKLDTGRDIDAQYGPLQTNDLYVHQKWVLHLCEQGSYSKAIEVLEQAYQRRPDSALFDGGRYAVYGMWSRKLLEGNRVDEALAVLNSARRRYGDREELLQQEVLAFEAGIARLAEQGAATEARSLRGTALSRHPHAKTLHNLKLDQAVGQAF